MLEGITTFFRKLVKPGLSLDETSKDAAKERLHLVLMQDRANVSADFLDLMKQEIIEVIKKYVDVDEKEIDVRLTNQSNDDGTNGAPALYANIPIINIKNDIKGEKMRQQVIETQEVHVPVENAEKKTKDVKKDNIEEKEKSEKTKKTIKVAKLSKEEKTTKNSKTDKKEKKKDIKPEPELNNDIENTEEINKDEQIEKAKNSNQDEIKENNDDLN